MQNTYRVIIGNGNHFHGVNRSMFRPGESVEFTVRFRADVNTYVSSGEVRLEEVSREGVYGRYRFIMPEHDVLIRISANAETIGKPMDKDYIPPMGRPELIPSIGVMMMPSGLIAMPGIADMIETEVEMGPDIGI